MRPGLASRSVFLLDVLLLVVLIHIGTGSLHLRVFGNRLLKMELPVSGLGLLLQLGHLLERLVCTAFCVMLVVADNGLGGNLRLMGGFHAGVFLLYLMDFAVDARGKRIADLTDGLVCLKLQFALSLGDFHLVFKVEAGFAFTGFLVKDALFFQHLLGRQLLTSGIQTLMRLLRFSLQPFNPSGSWGIAVKVWHLCGGFRRSFQNGFAVNLPSGTRSADLTGNSGIGKCFSVVNRMGAVCLRVQRCGIIADGQITRLVLLRRICGLCFGLSLTLCVFQLIRTKLPPLPDLFGQIAGFCVMRRDKLGIFKALRHLFRSAFREVFFHSAVSGHPQDNPVFGLQFIMRHQISPPIRASASSLYSGFNSIPT